MLPAVATEMPAVLVCDDPAEEILTDKDSLIATLEHLPGLLAR